jgi:hypothetical protein
VTNLVVPRGLVVVNRVFQWSLEFSTGVLHRLVFTMTHFRTLGVTFCSEF